MKKQIADKEIKLKMEWNPGLNKYEPVLPIKNKKTKIKK